MDQQETSTTDMLPTAVQAALQRHRAPVQQALQRAVMSVVEASTASESPELKDYYGQILYHLGWVDANFTPVQNHPGKLMRPVLLLLAYEAAGAWNLPTTGADYLRRALPAAAAVELTHNFSLIHDDIEDGDAERRHRETLWKLWGIPQAINAGDGLYALSRLVLWHVLDAGVDGALAARLGAILDQACLVLSEGQYLDMSFEQRQLVTVAHYIDMIRRKTAALMACSAEMGARLGTRDEATIQALRNFGDSIGIAFQVRDDLLGVWAARELGKTPAGDIYRRKKSLPILHALEHASQPDQDTLRHIYSQKDSLTETQVELVLNIFSRTETRAYCRAFLAEQCRVAQSALANVPRNSSPISALALNDLQALLNFVAAAALP